MNFSFEVIIFYILLADALAANAIAWFGQGAWYNRNFRIFSRAFPVVKGWTTYYLALVLWIGFLLYRFGAF